MNEYNFLIDNWLRQTFVAKDEATSLENAKELYPESTKFDLMAIIIKR